MDGIEWLNGLAPEQAERALLACCGSSRWARAVSAKRPFADADDLLSSGDAIWRHLNPEDWLEAFRAHPRIGESPSPDQAAGSADWSRQEQAGVTAAPDRTRDALAAGHAAYERRFGYIFIVCATGRTADQMLAMLNVRLEHDPGTELRTAAEEQRQITRLRLEKLLATHS